MLPHENTHPSKHVPSTPNSTWYPPQSLAVCNLKHLFIIVNFQLDDSKMLHENWKTSTKHSLPSHNHGSGKWVPPILVSFLIWGNFPLPWLWEKGSKHGCLGYQVCDFGYPKSLQRSAKEPSSAKIRGAPGSFTLSTPDLLKKRASANAQLPCDFEDSGVLKRSSFSRKIHHPWLLSFLQYHRVDKKTCWWRWVFLWKLLWKVGIVEGWHLIDFSRLLQPTTSLEQSGNFTWMNCPNPPAYGKKIAKNILGKIARNWWFLPSLKLTVRPWKWMVGIRSFPFGMGEVLVSGRENSKLETSNYKGVSKHRGKTPQIIHLEIGFSIIFTIHLGGTIIFGNTHKSTMPYWMAASCLIWVCLRMMGP